MAKTETTNLIEQAIFRETNKQGVFGCFEVTIGWFGKERVDYMTYDTKGIWRCFEIKVSKSDFYSKSNVTFLGHYNYYVIPEELFEQVAKDIPSHVGCYIASKDNYGDWYVCSCKKRAKKCELGVDEQIMKDSFIRSLSREAQKQVRSGDVCEYQRLQRKIKELTSSRDEYRRRYQELDREIIARMGGDYRWRKRFPLPDELEDLDVKL